VVFFLAVDFFTAFRRRFGAAFLAVAFLLRFFAIDCLQQVKNYLRPLLKFEAQCKNTSTASPK